MKLPRDLSGAELAKLLGRYGYKVERQTGSHLRLSSARQGSEHKITVPNHSPIKVGTLSGIIAEVASYLKTDKQSLLNELFP